MKNIKIKRLYKDLIDIRSDVVEKHYTAKESVTITVDGISGKMTLTNDELNTRISKVSSKSFKSQFPGGKPYKLISYKWSPDL